MPSFKSWELYLHPGLKVGSYEKAVTIEDDTLVMLAAETPDAAAAVWTEVHGPQVATSFLTASGVLDFVSLFESAHETNYSESYRQRIEWLQLNLGSIAITGAYVMVRKQGQEPIEYRIHLKEGDKRRVIYRLAANSHGDDWAILADILSQF